MYFKFFGRSQENFSSVSYCILLLDMCVAIRDFVIYNLYLVPPRFFGATEVPNIPFRVCTHSHIYIIFQIHMQEFACLVLRSIIHCYHRNTFDSEEKEVTRERG